MPITHIADTAIGRIVSCTLDKAFINETQQRIARQWQIEELLRDFKWPLLGVLYGVDSTVINPSLEDMVAVVEGGNRLRLLKYMFPLGTYNEEHPLPKGKKLD